MSNAATHGPFFAPTFTISLSPSTSGVLPTPKKFCVSLNSASKWRDHRTRPVVNSRQWPRGGVERQVGRGLRRRCGGGRQRRRLRRGGVGERFRSRGKGPGQQRDHADEQGRRVHFAPSRRVPPVLLTRRTPSIDMVL